MQRTITLSIALTAILLVTPGGCRRDSPAPDEDSTKPPPNPSPLSRALEIEAEYSTAQLSNDPDDPAIWVHSGDPSRSLILGTMKVAAPAGAVVVFGMDGQIRQLVSGIDRPNNIDVEYGVALGGQPVDIAVATERLARRLRVFRIDPQAGQLVDLGGIPILEGQPGEAGAPMGIGLYRRARDGALFAIVAPKEGPREGYLWQYRLFDAAGGRLEAKFVRRFGAFSGTSAAERRLRGHEQRSAKLSGVSLAGRGGGGQARLAHPQDAVSAAREARADYRISIIHLTIVDK